MKDLIAKWEDKHATLLSEYGTYKGLSEFEGLCLRSEMNKILEFIEDLKRLDKLI